MLCLLIGAVTLVFVTGSARSAVVQNHSVGTTARDLVYNAPALRKIVDAAEARRVDIIGVGDSNQGGGGGYGWDHGYPEAWQKRYGWYATGVFGMNADGGWDGGQGYIDSWGRPWAAQNTGAPAGLDKFRLWYDALNDVVNDFPSSYAYLPPSYTETTAHWLPTTVIARDSKLWGQNLNWHLTYGTFENGNGGFTPAVIGPSGLVTKGPLVPTNTGQVGLRQLELHVGSNQYKNLPSELRFSISQYGEPSIQGPFFGLWQRVEGDKRTGVSYSTMLWQGGRGLFHAATALQAQSNEALATYLRNVVQTQHGEPIAMVQVEHGGNDGAFADPSVGPNPTASNTAAGFADNMHAVVLRLREVWAGMGFKAENLVFQYGPYHPVEGYTFEGSGVSRVQRLAGYEDAVIQLAQQHPEYNLAVLRGSRLTTPITMADKGWYDPTGSAHLTKEGYIGVAELAVAQTIAYAHPERITDKSVVTSLQFTFDEDVEAALDQELLSLKNLTTNTFLDSGKFAVEWDAATRTARWIFPGFGLGELPVGDYEGTLSKTLFGGTTDYTFNFTATPNPEPASVGLFAMAGLALGRRRRAAKRAA
jgi:MYXO-CTERM domain-containing protein